MLAFLKLIRFPNLIFIGLTLVLIKFGLFNTLNVYEVLDVNHYILLIIATVFVAAAGYIINDIYDVEADKINKPKRVIIGEEISEQWAYNLFFIFNIVGVGIGFYIANSISKPAFSVIFILSSALLYFYANTLKQIIFLGNVVVSLLVAVVILMPAFFDLLPAINSENREIQSQAFLILSTYALFAFLVNLLREMVKDQEDINGDYNCGIITLPILLGVKRTNKIIFAVGLISILLLVYLLYNYLYKSTAVVYYSLTFILAPLLYFILTILNTTKRKEFTNQSLLLKILLFFGILSIGLYKYLVY